MASFAKKAHVIPLSVSFVICLFLSYAYFPFEWRLEGSPHLTSGVHHNGTEAGIPNIVHYVWFLKNTDEFRLNFEQFVSIYSTHLYFKPDTIYIHTDATPEQVDKAKDFGNKWTRIIFALPNIATNQIELPLKTNTGKVIEKIEHRSDFARTRILYEMGGTYMDMDVIPIRDIKPLRDSGFANVVGQELNGGINSGMVMHKPRSALLSIFRQAQHDVFDGKWTTHSTELLTSLSNRLVPMPYEVLILQKNAFAPSSWTWEDMRSLLKPHNETMPMHADDAAALWPVPTTLDDAESWWDERLADHTWWSTEVEREPWEIDYSSSYVIHAFHNVMIEDWDNEITLEYVRARQSNYARAVYPAIWHAINTGVIVEHES